MGPPGEKEFTEKEVRERNPAGEGEWVAEGGSDWRNEAGEDGGAIKGTAIEVLECV